MRTLCGTILVAALPMAASVAFGGGASGVAVPGESIGRDSVRFALSLKPKPCATPRLVRSGEADSVRSLVLPDGDTEIVYAFGGTSAPVREARVRMRRSADGAVQHRISCETN